MRTSSVKIILIEVNCDNRILDILNLFGREMADIIRVREDVDCMIHCLEKAPLHDELSCVAEELIRQLLILSTIDGLYDEGVLNRDIIVVRRRDDVEIARLRHERTKYSYYFRGSGIPKLHTVG
jgi:hypothetical protein